jgi:hypothetical protein
MADREDCIDDIIRRSGGRRTREEAEKILADLDGAAQERESMGDTRSEAYTRARDNRIDDEARRAANARRKIRLQAVADHNRHRFYTAALANEKLGADAAWLAMEARMNGVNTPIFDAKSGFGNQNSVAADRRAKFIEWGDKGLLMDLKREGLLDLYLSRQIEKEWFVEKVELDRGDDGNPGRTRNPQAKRVAEIVHKWDKVMVDALNERGAAIENYSGFGTQMAHDPDKIRKASKPGAFRRGFEQADREVWADFTARRLDLARTFGSTDLADATQRLAQAYGGFVTGDHLQYAIDHEPGTGPDQASALSMSRAFHWKSAEDQYDYMVRFGRGGPTLMNAERVRHMANQWALLRTYGTRPIEALESDFTWMKNRTMSTEQRLELDRREKMLRQRFAQLDGSANKVVPNQWAGMVYGWMAINRLSKLGSTMLATLSDNATIIRELAYQGATLGERYNGLFSGYFQGMEGSAKRQVADLMGSALSARNGFMASRFDAEDAIAGTLAHAEHVFYKWTGLTAVTENKRIEAQTAMARHMGMQRGKDFEALGPEEQRILGAFGIGADDWALLHKTEWNELEGKTYLTPDVALRIPDADVTAYLRTRQNLAADTETGAAARLAARAKDDLAMKLAAYYAERGLYAVIDVGPRERAMLYRSNAPGDKLTLALQLLYQFKQFPTAMLAKAWGREIYGGATRMGRLAGMFELMALGTVFGMATNYLSDLTKGQDPNARWRSQPFQSALAGFVRGGMGSIYGDLLLGEWTRHGVTPSGSILGPTFGQIDKVLPIISDFTHGNPTKETAAMALGVVRDNTPGANIWWARAALNYLLIYRLQELINPGYLDRMERTMRDKQGIEFLLSPASVAR